jgi:hypothetical protein
LGRLVAKCSDGIGENGGEQQTDASFGNLAHVDEGKFESASTCIHRFKSERVLDSGATKHVASRIGEFDS